MTTSSPRSTYRFAIAVVALGLLNAPRADAASFYGVSDLGANVSSLRLNNPGQVAGLSGDYPNQKGFLFSGGRFTDLADGVQPVSLTDDGRVIDARGPYSYYATSLSRSWVSSGSATAGNHLGQLVGTLYTTPYGDQSVYVPQPYLYAPKGTGFGAHYIETLNRFYPSLASADGSYNPGILRPGDPTGRGDYQSTDLHTMHPIGINDSGQIVGNYFPRDPIFGHRVPEAYDSHAFLDKQDLGTLGGLNSLANAINNAGQVTGKADTASGASHAFLFTGGKMVDLGLLPGMTSSEGLGLNEKGDVVGTSGGHAFLYTNSTGIMEDLNDRLPATSGLTLERAVAINDAGQILAYGHGSDGEEHGLLLSPTPTPEPTTLALLALAAAGHGIRRLRNARG